MPKHAFWKSFKVHHFKRPAKFFFGAMLILYPLLVFCALVVFRFPLRYLSVVIILFAIVYIFINRRNYKGKHRAVIFISPAILCIIGIICLLTDSSIVLKLYPALADLVYVTIFGTSLCIPPPLVFYFIEIFDKIFDKSLDKSITDNFTPKEVEQYCRRATIAWCIFFMLDGMIAVFTVFWTSEFIWGLYNGGISYVAMALLLVGEFVMLKIIEKRAVLAKKAKNAMEEANVHH
jgi:uncharacterized membrane protein